MGLCSRMSRTGGMVQSNAQSGSGRHPECSVGRINKGGVVNEVGHPRIGEVVEVLQDLVVTCRNCKVHIGGGSHRPTYVVGRQKEIVGLRPAGELPYSGEPPQVGQIGLNDVDQTTFEQLPELGDNVHSFTNCEWKVRVLSYSPKSRGVVGRHRFLYPLRIESLNCSSYPGRHGGRKPAVHLDH